ncbi:hypothetical protein, partial [Paenibacillus sp. MAEPY1]
YYKYINRGIFHGRSISTFRSKHIQGFGHSTNATIYADFNVAINDMIRGWLNTVMFKGDKVYFNLDFSNISFGTGQFEEIAAIENNIIKFILANRFIIISRLSKKISYNFLKKEFHECYEWVSLQDGFKENLDLFFRKFSNVNYWSHCIADGLNEEVNLILNRMLLIK